MSSRSKGLTTDKAPVQKSAGGSAAPHRETLAEVLNAGNSGIIESKRSKGPPTERTPKQTVENIGHETVLPNTLNAVEGSNINGFEAFPSVLDLGRQIVRLSNKYDEMGCVQLALKRQGLTPREEWKQEEELKRLMSLAYNRECGLGDIALGMRARTLGDVAVNRPGFSGGSNFQVEWSHDEQDDEQIQP
jgi:hypothetical protein